VCLNALRFVILLSFVGAAVCCSAQNEADLYDSTPVAIPGFTGGPMRPVTSRDLATLRDVTSVRISPDGSAVAFVVVQAIPETNRYRSGLFLVATARDSVAVCLGTAGPRSFEEGNEDSLAWSADSSIVYSRAKFTSSWQVWGWYRRGGPPFQITHVDGDVDSFQIGPQGAELGLFVSSRIGSIDLQQLDRGGILYDGTITPSAWSSRSFLESYAQANRTTSTIWVHSLKDDIEHRASSEEEAHYKADASTLGGDMFTVRNWHASEMIMSAKASPDGKHVAYQRVFTDPSQFPTYAYPIFLRSLPRGEEIPLTPGAYDIAQYWWSEDSQRLYYTEYNGDGHSPRLLEIVMNGPTPESRELVKPTDWATQYSIDRNGQFVACTRETNTTPPQVALVDTHSGEMRVLVDVNPEFKNIQLVPGKRLEIANTYGDKFHAQLVLPTIYKAGQRFPLIVTTYRSGDRFLRGGTGDEYPIQVFAANGFCVLSLDTGIQRTVRTGDFESEMLTWESPVAAMKEAIDKLVSEGMVDRLKVGISGLSHGAEMVNYAISHTDLFHAAIASGSEARSPYFFYMGGKQWQTEFRRWGLSGWPSEESLERWKRLSPSLMADKIEAPLLVNAADSEYIEGLNLVSLLEELGKPVELFIYPNEGHVKVQAAHRYEIYERNLDWFRFWLKDEEDPNPLKKAQYLRWHKLREMNAKASSARSN
jgi:dipeptidyl aminopeptidase/acylaminoacyl peptidase